MRAARSAAPWKATPPQSLLVIPRGIDVVGMVRNADRLEIAGEILSPFVSAQELFVAEGGAFKGEIEVDEADIHGTMDGSIVVRRTLIVRATGKILGKARCGTLRVETGGRINARVETAPRP